MTNNENPQIISEVANTFQARKSGNKNVLLEAAETWKEPDEQIHTKPLSSIVIGGKMFTGEQIGQIVANQRAPILNLMPDVARALASNIDPAIVFVATNASLNVQRYSMLIDDNLCVAYGSPFLDPRESNDLMAATGITNVQLLEERALILEQAISAALLRKESLDAKCVGERALTTEAGHTFPALIAGSVFNQKSAMDDYVAKVMGDGTRYLTPHSPHNAPRGVNMRYEEFAVDQGVQRPNIYTAKAPLMGTAMIIRFNDAIENGWTIGIERSTVAYEGNLPKFYRAHVYGIESAAIASAAIYQYLNPDKNRMAEMVS